MTAVLTGKLTENDGGNNTGTSKTITNTGFAVNKGDAIIVCVAVNSTSLNPGVSDNVNPGNYTQVGTKVTDNATNLNLTMFVKENSVAVAAGALTVTASWGIAARWGVAGLVYSGIATSSSVDVTNHADQASTSTPNSGSISTTKPGDLIIGALQLAAAGTTTITEDSRFRQQLNDSVGTSAHQHLHIADNVLGNYTATLNYAPTFSVSDTCVIAIASFFAPSGLLVPMAASDLTPGAGTVSRRSGNTVAW